MEASSIEGATLLAGTLAHGQALSQAEAPTRASSAHAVRLAAAQPLEEGLRVLLRKDGRVHVRAQGGRQGRQRIPHCHQQVLVRVLLHTKGPQSSALPRLAAPCTRTAMTPAEESMALQPGLCLLS